MIKSFVFLKKHFLLLVLPMEAKVKWRRYLVQRRANPINPLQLEPRQLVFPVPIKDGLRKQRSGQVSAWNPKGGRLQKKMLSELWEHVVLSSPAAGAQRLLGGCASEIVTGLPLRS